MDEQTATPRRNMLGLQRAVALKAMGLAARDLLREGYATDADRVLDELAERREAWQDGQSA